MTEPVLSAVLLNDAEQLRTWSRKNFGKDFLELFKICESCGRPYGYHCKTDNRCPSLSYRFGGRPVKGEDFEPGTGFVLDKKTTKFFIAYLALIGVNFR